MPPTLPKLVDTYAPALWEDKTKNLSPIVQKMLREPHLALFINGDWLHILPGMIMALVTDPTKVHGIAPYRVAKVNTKPGREYIDLIAYTNAVGNSRKLRLGARYSGHFRSNVNDSDQAIEGAVAAINEANRKPDDE